MDFELFDKAQDNWDFGDTEVEDIAIGDTEAFKNDFVRKLKSQGGLHIHYAAAIQSIIEGANMESKLFFLFITKSYFDAVRKWTLENLKSSGAIRHIPKRGLPGSLFFAYVGLELGMSFCRYNQISDYWANTMFTGHKSFKETMGRQVKLLI